MVQFGKTENIHNTTNNSSSTDQSDKRSFFIEDKTHIEFIRSKDIFNVVNNYQNVNMSLLAASMAISVITPILNGLLTKAINRWNDEIPYELQETANSEYRLIHGKCERLLKIHNRTEDLQQIDTSKVQSRDFLSLQKIVNLHLKELIREGTDEIIEGIIKKDRGMVSRGERLLSSVRGPFENSFESHVRFTHSPEQIGIFQYDQAISALDRVLPSAMIGDSSTVLVRKMMAVEYLCVTGKNIESMRNRFTGIYNIVEYPLSADKSSVKLYPLFTQADLEIVSGVYQIDLTKVSNAHFFSSCQVADDILSNDANFSGQAIMEAKLGHSMSVLGETVNEVAEVMMDVLRRRNHNEDIQHSYRRVENGPWSSNRTTRQFCNLMTIFSSRTESDIIDLDEDFKTLTSLIRIVGTVKKLYPELMPKSDAQFKEYMRRTRFETAKIGIPSAPSYKSSESFSSASIVSKSSPKRVVQKKSSNPLFDRELSTDHLTPIDVSDFTPLDFLCLTVNLPDRPGKGVKKISELTMKQRRLLATAYKETTFRVMVVSGERGMKECSLSIATSEQSKAHMMGMNISCDPAFPGQLYYCSADILFVSHKQFSEIVFV